jgi:hypothetical protein
MLIAISDAPGIVESRNTSTSVRGVVLLEGVDRSPEERISRAGQASDDVEIDSDADGGRSLGDRQSLRSGGGAAMNLRDGRSARRSRGGRDGGEEGSGEAG